MKSTIVLIALMMPLASCVTVSCPPLAKPPANVVDAIEGVARQDKGAADWTIEFGKHYDKLKECRA